MKDTMNCPSCKNQCIETDSFCMKCGFNVSKYRDEQNILKEKVCPECSSKCNSTDSICSSCGFPLKSANTEIKRHLEFTNEKSKIIKNDEKIPLTISDEVATIEKSREKSNGKGFIIAAILAFILIVLGVVFYLKNQSNSSGQESLFVKQQETDTLKQSVNSSTAKANVIKARFHHLLCNVNYPSCFFGTENGDSLEIFYSQVLELSNYPSFFCDESYGDNRMINPYFGKEFELTFDKSINSYEKKLLDIKLIDKVDITYIFLSGSNDKYELRIKDLKSTLELVKMNLEDKLNVRFNSNLSVESYKNGKSLFEISNHLGQDGENDTVILYSYDSMSDDYREYYLEDSIIH